MLATGLGNPAAVRVCTGKTVQFGSRPNQKPNPVLLGGPDLHSYMSYRVFCQVWLGPLVPVSGSPFRVFPFMVTVWYVPVMCKISTLVHHSLYLFHWWPLSSTQGETCSLLRPEVMCDQLFVWQHLLHLRSGTPILIGQAVIQLEFDPFAHATAPTTFGGLMEIDDSVSGKSQCHKEHPGIE